MHPFLAEFFGSLVLILLGVGVNANVSLKDSYAYGGGWVVVAFGWGFAVFAGVTVAGPFSGAHLNPAVSVGLAVAGRFPWQDVPLYMLAQLLGSMAGALLAWVHFSDHYDRMDDKDSVLGTFCTSPSVPNTFRNIFSEAMGTFVLIFVVLYLAGPSFSSDTLGDTVIGLGSIGALPVAFLVVSIGMSLGGTTGYAINPTRDFAPRLVHALVPIKGKRDSNWSYSWIPVVGPIIGAVVAGVLFLLLG